MADIDPGTQLEQSIVATQQTRSIPDTNSMLGASTPESDIAQINQKVNDQEVWFNNLLIANVTPLQHLIKVRVVSVSGDYTADIDDDLILVDAAIAPVTITLPSAITFQDRFIFIKKVDSSTNAVTVEPTGLETIDNGPSYVISTQYSAVELTNNDSNKWYVVAVSGALDTRLATLENIVFLTYESKSGDYDVTGNDNVILVTCSSADITITLPAANTVEHRRIIIKKMDSTSHKVKVVPTGTDKIDDISEYDLIKQYDFVEVISDHSANWYIVGEVPTQIYPRCGSFTVTDPNDSATVSLSPAEPNTSYYVVCSPSAISGNPVSNSYNPQSVTKGTSSFTVTLSSAPGSSNAITYDYVLGRASY